MKIRHICFFLIMVVSVMFYSCRPDPGKIRLSPSKVEKIISAHYPLRRSNSLGSITLYTPTVYFTDAHVVTRADYRGTFMSIPLKGCVVFKSAVYYNKKNYSFYLINATVQEIKINRTRFSHTNRLSKFILNMIGNFAGKYPVYRLDQNDFRQNLAKIYLKEVKIRKGRLVLILEK